MGDEQKKQTTAEGSNDAVKVSRAIADLALSIGNVIETSSAFVENLKKKKATKKCIEVKVEQVCDSGK